ncbi:T3SS effector HopA1 family protein [Pseudomonas sp. MAFF 311095]|uniref:T3SS effector HopA1 family protein n=1 Tax=Pseudomonas petroselini TaxID=2899822 RepID=A0ABS8QZX0_9PSED|nr:lanthionine synthetase LanC family protein [Pseudomonas petroselini]MCD7041270.1 T3SS effector HopA1 family protein [Pseudomonas petroselini]MCD7044215.1 T3SS effector HopA1 family protein [Pseudomonas petroselini]MCD7068305.1 T3SS effector HopA1 family protein [Pseudomonas petroselini]MCD7077892.1 T3SS effector HopA1 family protein [Pseudomonas petroselini]
MNALNESLPGWWATLSEALNSLAADDRGTLWLDGLAFTAAPLAQQADGGGHHDDPRIERLQQYLYQHYYAACVEDPNPQPMWYPPVVPALDGSNWQVLEQLGGGALAVQQGRVARRVEAGEYLFDGVPARAIRGQHVKVQRAAWTDQLDPAFIYLFGETPQDTCNEDCLLRYYVAPRPARLGEVVQALSHALDQVRVPYLLKYPSEPTVWMRQDAVVLYIAARHGRQVHGLLGCYADWLRTRLRSASPLWTWPLLPGLGVAQDPGDGRSFGESRCRALALALLDAACHGTDLLQAVQVQFGLCCIDWDYPHLEADPEDRYGLRQLSLATGVPADVTAVAEPMQEAIRIGHQLCAEALWLGERCTWLSDDADDTDGPLKAFACSMSASLYDGTVGVAAFLVLLAEQTAQPAFVETARGALRHALAFAAQNALSLYEGRLGTVTQGLWLARRLGDAALVEDYQRAITPLLQDLLGLPGDPQPVDLMHGLAGAIIGLLGLAHQAPVLAPQIRVIAQALGQRLVQQAQHTAHGWHWPEHGAHLGLCGLSHGNAGIALAFAQLARECPGPEWSQALAYTLAYESHWFVEEQGNWPYLFAEDARHLDDRVSHCGMAWCHGAPGIALSRLALWQISGEEHHRAIAHRALHTVAADLAAATSQAGSSYTLCHGPAGNADILLTGAALLGEPGWAECARQVARRGLAAERGAWRSGLGVAQGQSMGLMLGLAGTGYFLLRCGASAPVPSLLLPLGLTPLGDV